MAAYELNRNYATRYCVFAIDSEDDLKVLPTSKKSGIESMSLSTPCRQGSIARATNGKCYILDGKDKWKYSYTGSAGGGSGSTGGDGDIPMADVEPIPQLTIESLFK